MIFFESFESLKVSGELRDLYADVEVVRIVVSKRTRHFNVYLESPRILNYRQVIEMERTIHKQITQSQKLTARIHIRFRLSAQYTLPQLMPIYFSSILDEIHDINIVLFHILKQSEWKLEDQTLVIPCEDNFLSRQNETVLSDYLIGLFEERFGIAIQVKLEFHEPKAQKESGKADFISIPSKVVSYRQEEQVKTPGEKSETSENKEKTANKDSKEKAGKREAKRETSNYRRAPKDPDMIYGRNCDGNILPISEIQEEIGEVVVQGQIFKEELRELRSGNYLEMFTITDFTDSISCKMFVKAENKEEFEGVFEKGMFVRVKGMALMDSFSHEIALSSLTGVKPIASFAKNKRTDQSALKRVELHAHTQMSDMDAVVAPGALVSRAYEWGHPAVAITDHGVAQAFPIAYHKYQDLKQPEDFKIIYGVEAYLVDDSEQLCLNAKEGQTLRDSFVVFDIETTGFHRVNNRIIEIGAVKIENGVKVDEFSEFINPQIPIPYEITKLTSITDQMVMDASPIEVVLPAFLQFCEGSSLVAHNAHFDVGFITEKAKQLGIIHEEFTVLDTMTMARVLLTQIAKFNLKHVSKTLGISLENHHRAVDDAAATAEIFERFIHMLAEQGITTLDALNAFGSASVDSIKKANYYHLILLAQNETGRINLYKLISLSHTKYFNKRPRIPMSLLQENREGILVGSACEAGELYRAILNHAPDEEIGRLVNFYDYLEIQPLGNNQFMLEKPDSEIKTREDLIEINKQIVRLGERYGKKVVATCDVHFMDPEDEVYRRILLAGKGFKDADSQPPLYFRTTEEMLNEFSYLGPDKAMEVVVTNTVDIANQIENISPVRPDKCAPVIPDSDKTLTMICYNKAHSMYGEKLPAPVEDRLEHELNSIIKNGFAVMYIIAQKLVWKSNEDGYLVGSRGSVGSSFVATMSGITEVNPLPAHYYCPECHYSDFDSEEVKNYSGSSGFDMPDKNCPVCGAPLCKDGHDIPFETFLGFYGDKEPDIDLNFSGEYQSKAHEYTEVIFGAGNTFRAGTVGTLADKTAYGYVKNYYEERGIHKRSAEIERIIQGCVGVRRTTGQHPGGIVVLPHGESIYSFTPVQKPANDMTTKTITTHFEYHSIDHNLLKLDILGHDDPTMIRFLEDLTGIDALAIPLDEQKVLSLFANTKALGIQPKDIGGCDLGSLGIPEFGTDFVMQMLRDTKPKNFSDLVRISGLSHGTDVWINNAQYYIANGDCTLSTAICTRDDIMTYLIHTGVENGQAFKIMESVRKGRGLKPEMETAMIDAGVPEWYMESCKKIQYMFPKAHAVAYVMMAFRIAYFKVYYPLAYYAAFFSIRAKAFDYSKMCQGREHLEHEMAELVRKGNEMTANEQNMLKDMKIVQEMYARGYEFLPIDIYSAKAHRFQIVDGKLMPSISTIDGLGDKAADAVVEAALQGEFLSRDDFRQRSKVSTTVIETMSELGLFGDLPMTNQMSLLDFL